MNPLSQAIVSGTISGTIYALLATGLIIAFQTTRIVNLAHGETFAIGGLITAAAAAAGMPLVVAMAGGVASAVVYSIVIERVLLRPRASWPVSSLILISLAAAFLSRGALQVVFGSDAFSFKRIFVGPPIRFAGGVIPLQGLALIVIGLIAAVVTAQWLTRTRIGKQLRATAENADAAQLLGVNVDAARMISFGLAGILGGLSAVLLVPLISVDYQTGLGMTLRGFIAASLAGMSPVRAIYGGLGLGLAEALVTTYFGALAQDPIIFIVLIAVALWQSRHVQFGGSLRA
jgi:branched-subunit amino acid ABC-type transport system permease component